MDSRWKSGIEKLTEVTQELLNRTREIDLRIVYGKGDSPSDRAELEDAMWVLEQIAKGKS